DPEEKNVVAGNQDIRRIEVFVIRRLVWPAEDGKGPELRREPGVEDVRILLELLRTAHGAALRVFFGDSQVSVLAGESRNAVAPPKLARDAPIPEIFHPGKEGFVPVFGRESNAPARYGFDGGPRERTHLDEPLLGEERLDDVLGSLAS